MKAALRSILLAKRDILALFFGFREVSILCYHSIRDAALATAITPVAFEAQLDYLRAYGYTFVSLDAILDWMAGEAPLPKRAVAITFDDGYADFETAALPVLERLGVPAALFVMGDGAASRVALGNDIPLLSTEALERVRNHLLVTVGYHSMTHANLAKLAEAAVVAEMKPPFPAAYFAYPGGNYSPEAMQAAEEAGYKAAFSIKRHLVRKDSDPFLMPRSVITRDMSLPTVRFHATRALEWYRALARLAKV